MSSQKTPEELLEISAAESPELLTSPEELLELVAPPPPEWLLVSPSDDVLAVSTPEPMSTSIDTEIEQTIDTTPSIETQSTSIDISTTLPTSSDEISLEPIEVSAGTLQPSVPEETEDEMLDDTHLFDAVEDTVPTEQTITPPSVDEIVVSTDEPVSTPIVVSPETTIADTAVSSIVPGSNQATVVTQDTMPVEQSNPLPAVDIPVPPTISSIPFEPANPIVPTTPPSSHKTLFIAGGVIWTIILATTLYFVFAGGSDDKKTPTVEYTVSAEVETPQTYEEVKEDTLANQEQDIAVFNDAVTKKDRTLCDGISDILKKTECNETIILSEISAIGTLDDCGTLTLEPTKTQCQATLTQKEAVRTMNKTLCGELSDTDQAQYCREEIDEMVVANLIESKTATQSSCTQLEKKYQEACLASVARVDDKSILDSALATDNLEKCQSLSTEELQVACFDSVLLKRALANGDKSVCELIRDTAKQDACLWKANAMNDNDIFKKAIVDKDLKLCATITAESIANKCHDSVTMLIVRDTRDVSLCSGLKNSASLQNCQKLAGAQ